jgi:rhamnogalacturonyl hydrolase YesR
MLEYGKSMKTERLIKMIEKQTLIDRVLECAQWQLRNQVRDRHDANKGRFIRSYDKASGRLIYTGNWQTGAALMSLLSVYRRTGEKKYLEAAEYAGHYIMSLQILDQRESRFYGAIRELTPQSMEMDPRDATTAAWALVWLYKFTGEDEYLRRAVLFGDFHLKYCMIEGWPQYSYYMEKKFANFYARGSFQSGTGLFYYDLFMASEDARYIEFGLRPIADNYLKYFVKDNGEIIQEREIFTWNMEEESEQKDVTPSMHMFNDDFGAAMLQTASDLFKDEKYRQGAYRYAQWLANHQDEDGGFCDGAHPSAVPTALMYFHDLGRYYDDGNLLKAREKALEKLLAMQYRNTGDGRLDGAFKGRYEGPKDFPGGGETCVNNRVTSYALSALVKLESDVEEIWLGRNNKKFVDPLMECARSQKWHDLKW